MLQTEGTSSGEQADHHGEEGEEEYAVEEEYEDEEDRLIAQGGIGIPLDEVSICLWHCTRMRTDLIAWTTGSSSPANKPRTYRPEMPGLGS